MSRAASKPTDLVSQLCPACGLCCNGVLFADVELQRGDRAKQLAAAGLDLKRRGGKVRFPQPCACFDGRWCRIYAERPAGCRRFECRLLQRAQAGEVSVRAALKTIAATKRQAETVRRLVRELGQTDERLPLTRRYSQILAGPIDLAGDPKLVKRREELIRAVHQLALMLERDFLA